MQLRWIKQYEGYRKLFIEYNKKIPYHFIKETKYESWLYIQRLYYETNKLTDN